MARPSQMVVVTAGGELSLPGVLPPSRPLTGTAKSTTPVPGLRPGPVASSGQLWWWWVVEIDEFSNRYGSLLSGSYDCVDRIVLNAYYPLGHNRGGFRTWWRRWQGDGDESLDNAHLMRLAGRFARRVSVSARAHDIPVID